VDAEPEARLVHFQEVMDLVRMHLRFVIAADESLDERQFPASYCIYFLPSPNVYPESARSILANYQGNPEPLISVFSTIHTEIIPALRKCHPNKFFDMLDTFNRYLNSENRDIIVRHENSQEALAFMTKIETQRQKILNEIQALSPRLKEQELKASMMRTNYNGKAEAVQTRVDSFDRRRKMFETDLEKSDSKIHETLMAEVLL
jgi:hypothetical protein